MMMGGSRMIGVFASQALANPASMITLRQSDNSPAARMLNVFFSRPKPTMM